tara:strand:- start:965 stop:1282 length:318 start_codon:yes stop_codon:yes gene_type:complete
MSKTVTFIIATLLLLLTTNAHSHTDAAEAAALAWLEAIDSGEYEQAWEASSTLPGVILGRLSPGGEYVLSVKRLCPARLLVIMRCLRSRPVLKKSLRLPKLSRLT